jgi:glycosyltransferase involved in cell wall biosynthesis
MPQVSVIMPTYNRGWIIERAVHSVLAQTYTDFELIVIDDGSTDSTIEQLQRIDDRRLVVVQSDHRGQAVARNIGLAHTQSDLIAYLDTDNTWHANFLEVLVSELTADYVMAYCSQHLFLVEGTRQSFKIIGRKVRSVPYNPVSVVSGSYIDTNSVLHRRSVITEFGGFDEQLTALTDWGLFSQIAARHPFAIKHVDQVLCDYYFYPRSLTTTTTNSKNSDAQVRGEFGLPDDDLNAKRIRARVRELLR